MKKFSKMMMVALSALVLAAALGTTTIGCGDDTTSTSPDLSVPKDMATPKPKD